LIAASISEGTERILTTNKLTMVGRVLWLSDGQGLVIDALSNPLSTGTQIWYVAYPSGVARRVTNDLNGYGTSSLGVSSDGNTIATVKEDYSQPIAVIGPNEDPGRERQISNGKYEGTAGIAVTPDGKIVYCSPDGDANNIWIMNADGSGKRQLTSDQFSKAWLAVTPDGSKIVFGSTRSGAINLWRMDIDGNNQRQLTDGPTRDFNPTFSPDGKWILFNSVSPGNEAIWKVPIDGGKAEKVLDRITVAPTVSPDGKFIACFFFDEKEPLTSTIGVFPFEGGDFVKTFRVADTTARSAGLMWAPDGQSLTYVDGSTASGANIMSQPIAGGPPKQLTKFKSDRIYTFAWTHDGKQLVYSRGPFVDDVVLIKDFR
jgi:Tol biopolymer transport system component